MPEQDPADQSARKPDQTPEQDPGQPPDDRPRLRAADRAADRPRSRAADRAAAAARIQQQQTWVDVQVRQAMERGEFENLPGAGKPIEGLGTEHDPDWWVKRLVERERIALLPPSIALRKEDAGLEDALDRYNTEGEVRRHLEDFNARVIRARYSLSDGPPLVTMPRDVDAEVEAWQRRLAARRAAAREAAARAAADAPARRRRGWRWWNRG